MWEEHVADKQTGRQEPSHGGLFGSERENTGLLAGLNERITCEVFGNVSAHRTSLANANL